jgi:hypothetical protein
MAPAKERTKVVVRGLPPALTEDALRGVVDKLVGGRYGWSAFYPGKVRCGRRRAPRAGAAAWDGPASAARAARPRLAPPTPTPDPFHKQPQAHRPRARLLRIPRPR